MSLVVVRTLGQVRDYRRERRTACRIHGEQGGHGRVPDGMQGRIGTSEVGPRDQPTSKYWVLAEVFVNVCAMSPGPVRLARPIPKSQSHGAGNSMVWSWNRTSSGAQTIQNVGRELRDGSRWTRFPWMPCPYSRQALDATSWAVNRASFGPG